MLLFACQTKEGTVFIICLSCQAAKGSKGLAGLVAVGTERGVVTVWNSDEAKLHHHFGEVSRLLPA